jgi:hypothetical protein
MLRNYYLIKMEALVAKDPNRHNFKLFKIIVIPKYIELIQKFKDEKL